MRRLIYFVQQSFRRLGKCRPGHGDRASIRSMGFPMPAPDAEKMKYPPVNERLLEGKAAYRIWKDCQDKG